MEKENKTKLERIETIKIRATYQFGDFDIDIIENKGMECWVRSKKYPNPKKITTIEKIVNFEYKEEILAFEIFLSKHIQDIVIQFMEENFVFTCRNHQEECNGKCEHCISMWESSPCYDCKGECYVSCKHCCSEFLLSEFKT